MYSLDDSTVVYVKTRDYSLCQCHYAIAFTFSMLTLPSYIALPIMTELQPALLILITSSILAIPPLAIILADIAASVNVLISGPCSVPSRSMLVSKNSSTPIARNLDIASVTVVLVDSFQPFTITIP